MSDVLEEEDEMFVIERLDWTLEKPYGRIVSLATGNNTLLMGTDAGFIVRFTVLNDSNRHHVEIPSRGRVHLYKVFLDPTASHALVSMREGVTYYLPIAQNPNRVINVKGLRGHVVESVAWNKLSVLQSFTKIASKTSAESRSSVTAGFSTGNILIGTRKGAIFELCMEDSKERGCKKLWEVDDGSMAICGIQMEIFPSEERKYFVMAATTTRHYQFVGGPTFEAMFARYVGTRYRGFQELPGYLAHSELHFQYDEYPLGCAKRCAWLTQAGIFQGDLKFRSQSPGEKVCDKHTLIHYPSAASKDGHDKKMSSAVPRSIATSRFHFLMLFDGRFVCTNRLSRAVVYDISLEEDSQSYGEFRGLASDLPQGTVWMFSDRCIFEVIIQNEERDVWKLYLQRNDFEAALRHCGDNRANRDIVLSAQADSLFKDGKYVQAAKFYSKTTRTFEEISLKFVNERQQGALKLYLMNILASLPAKAETQLTMVATWITEIFLDSLRDLDVPLVIASGQEKKDLERAAQRKALGSEFRRFLEDHYDILDQQTTFSLISSHGRAEELVHYAEIIGDRDWLIRHSLSRGKAKMALLILAKYWTRHSSGKRKKASFDADIFYRYTPTLLTHSPRIAKEMVTTLTRIDRNYLSPARLIPAFIRYDNARVTSSQETGQKAGSSDPHKVNDGKNGLETGEHQGIRYYAMVVDSREEKDPSVHNYLLSLLVKEPNDEQLIKYIVKFGTSTPYDHKLALSLCYDHDKIRACAEIHKVKGNYEDSVNLALGINLQLAQLTAMEAERAGISPERTKRLWLLVARHVIKRAGSNVLVATEKISEILKHCTLSIEEILPYFPDFVKIGSLKAEIVRSLENYNMRSKQLKIEMDDYTHTAKLIKKDIEDLEEKSGHIRENRKCDLSSEPVVSQPFVFFPCGHVFLTAALTDHIIDAAKKQPQALFEGAYSVISVVEEKVRIALKTMAKEHKQTGTASLALINLTRKDWSRLASLECPLCGSLLLNSCHDPLVDAGKEELESWAIS